MQKDFVRSVWAKAVFLALALMWGVVGWAILLLGGYDKGFKYSRETIHVDGWAAAAMALLFLLLSAIAVAVVLQSLRVSLAWHALSAVFILGLPALFLILR